MTDRELESLSADPALGLRLRNALTYYADDQKEARLFFVYSLLAQVPAQCDGALTDEKRVLLAAHRFFLIQELVTKLRKGALFARGFLPNSLQILTVPAEWWTSVRLDLDANQAEANGTCLQGVLVYETVINGITVSPHEPPKPRRSGFAGRPTSRPLMEAEMRARADRGELLPTLAAEARYLIEWLKNTHPEETPPGQSGAEGSLRNYYKVMLKSLK